MTASPVGLRKRLTQAELMQDELRQTEAGEGGLDEVEADEHGQQQPPGLTKCASATLTSTRVPARMRM